MKKLILIFVIAFASPSYAEWTEVTKTKSGITFYVNFDTIRKIDGYVNFWRLSDFPKPIEGYFSAKVYYQGDCKLFRYKALSVRLHTEAMEGGLMKEKIITGRDRGWIDIPPDTKDAIILKAVCNR